MSARMKNMIILDRVPYIHYQVPFQKGGKEVTRTLINSASESDTKTPAYTKQLGLQNWQTYVGAKKIVDLSLEIFRIIIPSF